MQRRLLSKSEKVQRRRESRDVESRDKEKVIKEETKSERDFQGRRYSPKVTF